MWNKLPTSEHGEVNVINSPHTHIHHGHYFSAWDTDTDIDIAIPKDYLFITGVKECHFVGGVSANAGITAQIHEGATKSANGTAMTAYNRKRASANASTALLYFDPTITGTGTALPGFRIYGAGAGINQIGGSSRADSEWVLKINTIYLIRLTAAADNTAATVVFEWYEETPE